jgi:hypothetical protein
MGRIAMAGLMAAALAGCTVQAQTTTPASGGDNTLAAFGSPLLVLAKVPVCIATIVVAAPVGAVSELSDPATPFGHDLRQGLSDGIAQNCGPPYVVAP